MLTLYQMLTNKSAKSAYQAFGCRLTIPYAYNNVYVKMYCSSSCKRHTQIYARTDSDADIWRRVHVRDHTYSRIKYLICFYSSIYILLALFFFFFLFILLFESVQWWQWFAVFTLCF